METEKYTKYEKARILGSRALQISMGAPFLVKLDEKDLEKLNFDSLAIAKEEFKEGVVPITVRRPLPIVEQEVVVEKKQEAIEETA